MSIITKPYQIPKNSISSISLSKEDLALISSIANNDYFSNMEHWQKIKLNYRSSEGNQTKIVEFDATQEIPTGVFWASSRSRDVFIIQSIDIVDFDNQVFKVHRSELTTNDFDIDLTFSDTAPDAPSSLTLLPDISGTSIGISFSQVSNSTYNIYRKTSSEGSFSEEDFIASSQSNSFTDSDASLQYNQIYYYSVKSVRNGLYSDFSSMASTCQVTPWSTQPSSNNGSSLGNVSISWTLPQGANKANIVYSLQNSGSLDLIIENVSSPYQFSQLVGSRLRFKIVAINDQGLNGNNQTILSIQESQQITNFYTIPPLSSPTGLMAYGNHGEGYLWWTAVQGASSYDIYRGTTSTNLTLLQSGCEDSTYTDQSVQFNTTYYYKVKAYNGAYSGFSNAASAKISTDAPTVTLSVISEPNIKLNWTALTGASLYKIYRAIDESSFDLIDENVLTNSYTDTSSEIDGATRKYKVVSYNDALSNDSEEKSIRLISNFNSYASTVNNSEIEVTWDSVLGASAYDIAWGTSSGSMDNSFSEVGSPYLITGLTSNTTYYITVTAKNSIGVGRRKDSSEVSAKTSPSAPLFLSASAIATAISLSWNSVTGATSYKVYRGTTSGSYTLLDDNVATNSYSDTGTADTTYYYVVKANNGSDSAYSNEASATATAIVSAPTNLFAFGDSEAGYLSWDFSEDVTSYDIYRGSSSGNLILIESDCLVNSYNDQSVQPNTTYYYKVKAYNGSSFAFSDEVSVKISTASPDNVTLSQNQSSGIELSWSAKTGSSYYEVYRKVGIRSFVKIADNITASSYTDTNPFSGINNLQATVEDRTISYTIRSYNGSYSLMSEESLIYFIDSFSASSESINNSTIDISWDSALGASSYEIIWGTSSGNLSNLRPFATSPCSITGLSSNTTYYFKVVAKNTEGNGNTVYSSEVSSKTAPSAPANLSASAIATAISLSWDSVAGATSYKVYRGTASGTYSLLDGSVATNSYSDTGTANTTYYYVVKANASGQDSAYSSEANTKPIANFSAFSLTSLGTTSVQATWTGGAGASTYDISYGTASGSYTTTVENVTSPYSITGLSESTSYYVKIKAKNSLNAYTNSSEVSANTDASLAAPSAPTSLLASSSSSSSISLSWDSVAGATSYKVYRGTASGTYSLLDGSVATNSYSDTSSISANTTYYYVVKANNGLDSANSSEASAKPIANFSAFSTSVVSSTSVQATWTGGAGASTYDISYGTSAKTTAMPTILITGVVNGDLSGSTPKAVELYIGQNIADLSIYGLAVGSNANTDPTARSISFPAVSVSAGTYYYISAESPLFTSFFGYAPDHVNASVLGNGNDRYLLFQNTTLIDSFGTASTDGTGTAWEYTDGWAYRKNSTSATSSFRISDWTVSKGSLTGKATNSSASPNSMPAKTWTMPQGNYTTTVENVTSPYSITGLTPDSSYFFAITAKNSVGGGARTDSDESKSKTYILSVLGTDGALVVANGQTVDIAGGSVKQYSSINVQTGGTLRITGTIGEWTEIGCLGNCTVNGQIIARAGYDGLATHSSGSFTKTSSLGLGSLSYNISQSAGGVGGRGSAISGTSHGNGGAQNAGVGGGGAGGSAGSSKWGGNGGSFSNGNAGVSGGTGGAGGQFGAGANGAASGNNGAAGASGGGGGGVNGTSDSWGGGGGGGYKGHHGKGLVLCITGTLSGTGSIVCSGRNGFNGGRPGAGISGSRGGGGGAGAGGSGGKLIVRYANIGTLPTVSVAGGTGGTGGAKYSGDSSAAVAGSVGSAGTNGIIDMGVL